jgi:hypothetical protein
MTSPDAAVSTAKEWLLINRFIPKSEAFMANCHRELIADLRALLVLVRNVALEDAIQAVAGSKMIGPSPIGPLHETGWNGAVEHIEARIRAMKSSAPAIQTGWRTMESAPKDGTDIIYKANRNGEYVSSCAWRSADEGQQEGWWDDACTEYAEPLAWTPLPEPLK